MAATQGSVGSARAPKTDKTRRCWIEKEEEVLLASLKELVAQGWKSDNGFRPGYITKLEDAMKKEFPLTDLKGTPHIVSRLTTWKKNYASLVSILKRSGVGFNLNGDFKVEANPDQWDQIYLTDNNASKIRGKGWPLFEGWKVVFGKDRATGENAEGVMDAVNEMMNEQVDDFINNAENFIEDLENDGHRDTNARLQSLASHFGLAAEVGIARKEVFALINKVPGLNLKENFKVCDILIDKPNVLSSSLASPRYPGRTMCSIYSLTISNSFSSDNM